MFTFATLLFPVYMFFYLFERIFAFDGIVIMYRTYKRSVINKMILYREWIALSKIDSFGLLWANYTFRYFLVSLLFFWYSFYTTKVAFNDVSHCGPSARIRSAMKFSVHSFSSLFAHSKQTYTHTQFQRLSDQRDFSGWKSLVAEWLSTWVEFQILFAAWK